MWEVAYRAAEAAGSKDVQMPGWMTLTESAPQSASPGRLESKSSEDEELPDLDGVLASNDRKGAHAGVSDPRPPAAQGAQVSPGQASARNLVPDQLPDEQITLPSASQQPQSSEREIVPSGSP
jgi:hypothetical protein